MTCRGYIEFALGDPDAGNPDDSSVAVEGGFGSAADALRVSPNPARRGEGVAIATQLAGAASVELLDATGRTVWRGPPGQASARLAAPGEPGLFLAVARDRAGRARATSRLLVVP